VSIAKLKNFETDPLAERLQLRLDRGKEQRRAPPSGRRSLPARTTNMARPSMPMGTTSAMTKPRGNQAKAKAAEAKILAARAAAATAAEIAAAGAGRETETGWHREETCLVRQVR
jgi:hypothetical protein